MWLVLAAALVTVQGSVTWNGPVPGVTVKLTCGTVTHTAITDADGRYAIPGITRGEDCTARYELDGFLPVERPLVATNADVPAQTIEPSGETITVSCGLPACSDVPPATPYEMPLCTDFETNTAWIEAARNGDSGALALLRARYAETGAANERHRIAEALLGRMHDDDIWTDLATEARTCIRWPKAGDELPAPFLQWCAERGVPAEEAWWTAYGALMTIAEDRRSRTLLAGIIDGADEDLVLLAARGLAMQRDERDLRAIQRAVQKFPDIAFSLTDVDWPALEALLEQKEEP